MILMEKTDFFKKKKIGTGGHRNCGLEFMIKLENLIKENLELSSGMAIHSRSNNSGLYSRICLWSKVVYFYKVLTFL